MSLLLKIVTVVALLCTLVNSRVVAPNEPTETPTFLSSKVIDAEQVSASSMDSEHQRKFQKAFRNLDGTFSSSVDTGKHWKTHRPTKIPQENNFEGIRRTHRPTKTLAEESVSKDSPRRYAAELGQTEFPTFEPTHKRHHHSHHPTQTIP